MDDTKNTKAQLIDELNRLRQQIADLQASETEAHPEQPDPDQSEQRFRTVLENMKLIGVMFDPSGRVTFCNDYLLELTGWQRDEVLNKSWFDRFLAPETRQDVQEALFAKAIRGEELRAFNENEILTRSGERRLIAWNNTAMYDSQNQCIGITSIGEDITERVQAEAALRQSEATARALLNAPADSVILINKQGTILDLNDTAAHGLDKPVADLIGLNLYDQFPTDIAESRKAHNQAILTSGQPRRYEDSRAGMWYDTIIYPVADEQGRVTRLAIVARDITERKKREERIHYQANLLDNVSDAIISTDLDFKIISWNKGAEALFGWSAGEAIGQSLLELTRPQSPHDSSDKLLASFFANGSWNGEMLQQHKDDHPVTTHARITLVKDDTGAPHRIVSAAHDITKRQQLEETLKSRANEVTLLYEVGKQLVHTLDLQTIYHTAHDVIYGVMDCARLYITTYSPADNLIHCVYACAQGKPLDVNKFPIIPLEQEERGTQSRVIRTGESLYLPDFQAHLRTARSAYHVDDEGEVTPRDETPEGTRLVRSGLIVPLKFEGQVMGTIQVLSLEQDAYTDDNLRFLEALSPQVTAVMVNATLFQQAQDEIAERKRSEEALRESEDRLRLLVENAGDMIFMQDLEGKYLHYSAAPQYGLTAEDVIGKTPWDLHNPADARNIMERINRVAESGERVTLENHVDWNGKTLWFIDQMSPVKAPNGQVIAIVTTSRNITERKQAELLLRQREEQIRAQYDGIPVATYTWQHTDDDDFILTAYNTAAFKVTQGKIVDLMGRKASDVYRERPTVVQDLARCYSQQATIERETPFRYVTTGEDRYVRIKYGFVPPDMVLIHADDITEQKSVEEAFQETQADLTEAQRIGHVGNWVHYLQTGERYWSDELFRIFGRKHRKPVSEETFQWIHPDDRDELREAIERNIQARGRLDTQFRIVREDGEVRTIHYQSEVISDATGKAIKTVGTVQDITDQKQSEAVLQQRAVQLALINEISGEIAAVLDLNRVLNRAAHLVQQSFGYQHVALFILDDEQEVLVMRAKAGAYAARFPENHRLKLGEGMVGWVAEQGKQLLANDVNAEPRFYNPFPDEVIVSEFSLPILVAHEVVGVLDVQSQNANAFGDNDVLVLETLADQIAIAIANARSYQQAQLEITERKQAEAALRESEQRYRALFEGANDAIFILDLEGTHLAVNRRAADMLGYEIEEMIGLSFRNIVVPKEHEDARSRREALAAGEILPVYERIFRKKNGVEFPVEINVSLTYDQAGNPLHIQSIVRDITERKQIEEALYFVAQRSWTSEKETFFPALVRYLSEKLAVDYAFIAELVDSKAQIVQTVAFCNKGELVDNIEYPLNHTPCQDVVGNRPCSYPEKAQQAFPRAKLLVDLQIEGYVGIPLWGSQGNPIGVIAVMHGAPLSNTPLIESLLQIVAVRAAHELERGQAEKQALELAVEKERSQILTKFIREASHEFRTPLSLINLNIYAIKRTTESVPHLQRLEAIEAVVQNITALVDDLMTMARLDGATAQDIRPVDINQILGDLIAIIRDFATLKNLTIVQDLDPNSHLYIEVNPEQLSLAFKNILDNAIRFTLEEGTVTVRTSRQEANLVIEVQDTGVGMSEDVLARIFERFYRVDEAHTTRGFGLGLPIVQKIVELHNGTIEVESTPGTGSTFRIILPT